MQAHIHVCLIKSSTNSIIDEYDHDVYDVLKWPEERGWKPNRISMPDDVFDTIKKRRTHVDLLFGFFYFPLFLIVSHWPDYVLSSGACNAQLRTVSITGESDKWNVWLVFVYAISPSSVTAMATTTTTATMYSINKPRMYALYTHTFRFDNHFYGHFLDECLDIVNIV